MLAPPSALEIVRTRSLASLVAEEMERMILSAQIAPGERLNEIALAKRLGVSRGPVREAIRGLERSGLIITVVNQGSYVRQVGEEEALEIYDVRAVLTGHACAGLAAGIGRSQMAELRALVRQMGAAQQSKDAAGYFPLNRQFHAALLAFAGNTRAARIYDGLGQELDLLRRRALAPAANMQESNAEHSEILRAIAAKDAPRARAAGEAHIRGGKQRFAATRPEATKTPQKGSSQSLAKGNPIQLRGRRTSNDTLEKDGAASGRGDLGAGTS